MKKLFSVLVIAGFALIMLGSLLFAGTKEDNFLVNDDRIFSLSNKYTSVLSSFYEEEVAALGINVYNYTANISKRNSKNEAEKLKALDSLLQTLNDIRPNSLSAYAQADYYTLRELIGLKYFDIENKNQLELDALWYLEPLNTIYQILIKDFLNEQGRIDYSLKFLDLMPETLQEAELNLTTPSELNLRLAIEKINLEITGISGLINLASKITEDKNVKNQFNESIKNLVNALNKYKTFLQKKLEAKNYSDFRIGTDNYKYLYQKVYMFPLSYNKLENTLKKNLDKTKKDLVQNITQEVIEYLTEEQLAERTVKKNVVIFPKDYYILAEKYTKAPEHNKILNTYSGDIIETDKFFVDKELFPTLSLPILIAPAPYIFKNKPSKITIYPPIPLAQKRSGDILITLPQKAKTSKGNNTNNDANYTYSKIKLNTAEFVTPGQLLTYSVEPANSSLVCKLSNDLFYMHGWIKYALDTSYQNGLFVEREDVLNYLWSNYKKAVYALVDYKLQTKDLDYNSALTYITEAGIKEEEAKTYLNYLALNPLDAVSYVIGAQEFERVKTKYKKQLGKDFNLATFHTKVLSLGRIPLIALEKSLAKAYAKKEADSSFSLTYF